MRNIVSPLDGFASPFGRADTGLRFLFANGEVGAWYDPSNLSTLFQDAAGTTPVATDADVVGLAVDTSEGGLNSLGPELVANGAFDTDSDWTLGTGWSIGGGVASSDGTQTSRSSLFQSSLVPGQLCQFSMTVSNYTSGNVRLRNGSGAAEVYISDKNTNGTFTGVYLVGASGGNITLVVDADADFVGSVDNISVREVPGNHASQSTTSYKPKWYSPNILRFDGVDDRLATTLKPTTTGSIAMRFKGGTASRVAFGAQPLSDGRCYLGLAADGSVAGGIGTQATSIIKGSTDKRGVDTTAILTWDGSTVTLYEDGVSVYSAAQSGAVDTANAFNFGSLNNAGSSAAHWDGDVSNLIVTDDVITAAEVVKIHNKWSA